ncbi:low affinity immunoglobulin gamma Fc region receptor III-B-like isoform X2 [Tamandua tetradactyla]|uniref:low affinity immunoglobulin gamma Fc region receptor III-B-like isoform X2 n=1 Tax=Tamandua tetradactyla TaxID=48850 RepID=UPI00405476F7
MWQLQPPMALLLLVAAGLQADPPKAVVLLDPPWDRVLKDDNVTLRCQGPSSPGDSVTQWFYNGSLLSKQDPSYFIAAATVEDRGEYRCRTGLSSLSDPVHLSVHASWLLLQSHRWVYQEGESILLRCHSWKNIPVHNVMYLQDGKIKKFLHWNTDFYISEAAPSDSGSYACRGFIGTREKNITSERVSLLVQGPAVPPNPQLFLPWHQIAFCFMMGLLFAVDTGLYFCIQRERRSSVGALENHQINWSQGLQDK